MKKLVDDKKSRVMRDKKRLIIIIILLIMAPLIINIGLAVTDIINEKWGITLTAKGLSNESWLDFWKYYMSIAIAFLSVYLTWDTANKDRKRQDNKESSDLYLENVRKEENALVEITKYFNTGIIYKALNQLDGTTSSECKAVLQSARDKIDEAHVKFELLTDLCDDFERCKRCGFNPCTDKRIKKEIRDMFYDMENHYIDMLNAGNDYIINVDAEKRNLEMIFNQEQIIQSIKANISIQKQGEYSNEDILGKQQELLKAEEQLTKLNGEGLNKKHSDGIIQSAINEIDYITNKRPKFIRYCKAYIDLKREHARDLKNNGVINYVKESQDS